MLNPIRLARQDLSLGQLADANQEEIRARQIRVLVSGDDALIRAGIRSLIEKLPELRIVAEASDGPEALRLIELHQPDVALIENALSGLNGFEVTARASKGSPEVHVIILAANADHASLRQALACGAAGYLTMNSSASELKLAIRTVANGEMHITSSAAESPTSFFECAAGDDALERLTPRQREVLHLLVQGNSTKQIAALLNISAKTIETHRTQLMERLDIHDIARLVRYAIKAGLIPLED